MLKTKCHVIEILADYWGDLSASQKLSLSSIWADKLIGTTRMGMELDRRICKAIFTRSIRMSTLYLAERYVDSCFNQRQLNLALQAMGGESSCRHGKIDEAISYAESSRNHRTNDRCIDSLCESILISSGPLEEAYQRYELRASNSNTYLMTFRAIARKYPIKVPKKF